MNLIELKDDRGELIYLNPNSIVSIKPTYPDPWGSNLIITTNDAKTTTYKSSKETFAGTALFYIQRGQYNLTEIQ